MIAIGDRLPDGKLRVKPEEGAITEVTTAELFAGQTVVLVGVPGAFTSTCHNAHVPQYVGTTPTTALEGARRRSHRRSWRSTTPMS